MASRKDLHSFLPHKCVDFFDFLAISTTKVKLTEAQSDEIPAFWDSDWTYSGAGTWSTEGNLF